MRTWGEKLKLIVVVDRPLKAKEVQYDKAMQSIKNDFGMSKEEIRVMGTVPLVVGSYRNLQDLTNKLLDPSRSFLGAFGGYCRCYLLSLETVVSAQDAEFAFETSSSIAAHRQKRENKRCNKMLRRSIRSLFPLLSLLVLHL